MISFDSNSFSELIRQVVRDELKKSAEEKVNRFYTVKEAADLLRVSVSTLHKWKATGKLKYHREGGVCIIGDDEIQRMLLNNKRG